jgi:uncharacterized protein YjbJ (UPF0337 family)
MVNQQVLSGKWDQIKGELKKKWGKLTDDDLRSFNGNVDQLVGRIQQKTGESRESIEQYLSQFSEEGSQFLSGLRDRIEETAGQTMDTAREGYESLRRGYSEAERAVADRPGQAMAVAFGLGVLSGLGIAALMRDRSYESKFAHSRSVAENFGKQLMDSISNMMPESFSKRS